jgi:hypothetical protein
VSPQDLDLELIESVLTNYLEPFLKVCVFLPLHSSETCQQSSSNPSHVHSIPRPYSFTTPPIHAASQNTLRALRFPACPPRHPSYPSSCSSNSLPSSRRRSKSSSHYSSNSLAARLMAWVDEGTRDGDHARVRLPSIPNFSRTGLLVTTRSYIRTYACRLCSNTKFMRKSGSVTMPWQPMAIPAAPLAHTSFTLLMSTLFPVSLHKCTVWVYP